MKFKDFDFSSEQVINALLAMQPKSPEQREMIKAAAAYMMNAQEKGAFNEFWQVLFPPEESRMGLCPACGAYLKYDSAIIKHVDEERVGNGWRCPSCKSRGLEFIRTVFEGQQITEVSDYGRKALQRRHDLKHLDY